MAAIDVERVRRDTPGCREVVHLNNAGSSLPPTAVTEAVIRHLELEARVGGYEAAAAEDAALEHCYGAIARLINAAPDEIAIVENATRAWDMAFYGLRFGPGDVILTSRAEYASNVIAELHIARRTGARIELVDDDGDGAISLADLERRLDDRVKLIALTHVPTQGGLVNPAAEVGHLARAAGVPFLLDACQSVGQLAVDVRAIGCDMLSATGRKFLRGPRGTGFLYVRRGFLDRLDPPFLDLHAATWTSADRYELRPDARRFENWEGYVAGKLGLAAAVDYALELGLDAIEARVTALAAGLRTRLAAAGARVHDLGARKSAIVTFTVPGHPSAAVKQALAARRINTSVSPVEYARFDFEHRGLPDLVRASVHYYNTEDELDLLVAALPGVG